MKQYDFKQLNNCKSEKANRILEVVFNSSKNLKDEYIKRYCFLEIYGNKIGIFPKIAFIPSSESEIFGGGNEEIRKWMSRVSSNMEMIIQLNNIINSLEYLKENIEKEFSPHLEMVFAGCISIYFSFFTASKGFNDIKKDEAFHSFDLFGKDLAFKELEDTFKSLEKLRNQFYCHKQSAIGYNILSMYLDCNEKIMVHTKEETKAYFIYDDMKEFLVKFRNLAEYTKKYIDEKRLKPSSHQLQKCLKKYHNELVKLIEIDGKTGCEHSILVQKRLENLSLKDRVDIQGNNDNQ